MTTATNNSTLLKTALLGNSAFSFISGLAFVLFSGAIAGFLGLSPAWIILALGIGLLLYGAQTFLAAREPVNQNLARFAVYADVIWVVASGVLTFTGIVPFTTAGKWAIAIVADIVLVFAILQYVGLKRMAK